MRTISSRITALTFLLASTLLAQPSQPTTTIPHLVRISNTFHPADGQPAAPVESVTLSIYRDQQGGPPLWQETQNVSVDAEGRYSVLMGSTANDGLPLDVLNSTEPRWLGVKFNRSGEVEQPRTLLTSVPYALRSSDAETLGGLPASAYQLASSAVGSTLASANVVASSKPVANALKPRATSGTANYIGVFTDATDLGNSVMYQSGSRVGLGTTGPFDFFHVRFADTTGGYTGYAVQNLGSGAASYSGMLFYDQNGLLGQFQGFNNSTHEYRINNIASGGTINFMIGSTSKFLVANNGNIGIGTGTPGSALDVVGTINLSGNLSWQGFTLLPGFPITSGNAAMGISALSSNTTGTDNTAIGEAALLTNTTGTSNTALGQGALFANTTGIKNTAIGTEALTNNSTGSNNIAIGEGAAALVAPGNGGNIHIGTLGASGDSGTIRIGGSSAIGDPAVQTAFFVAGVRGVTTGQNNAVAVLIDSNGQLGTVSSSRRYKEDIHDMGDASRDLMRLRPVTFRYKKPFADGSKPIQYGLIAEEVAEVYPDLVARSSDGQIETVKYQVLPVMLLNEVQRQQAESHAQAARIEALEQQLQEQHRELDHATHQLDEQRQQDQLLLERLSKLEAALASVERDRE